MTLACWSALTSAREIPIRSGGTLRSLSSPSSGVQPSRRAGVRSNRHGVGYAALAALLRVGDFGEGVAGRQVRIGHELVGGQGRKGGYALGLQGFGDFPGRALLCPFLQALVQFGAVEPTLVAVSEAGVSGPAGAAGRRERDTGSAIPCRK